MRMRTGVGHDGQVSSQGSLADWSDCHDPHKGLIGDELQAHDEGGHKRRGTVGDHRRQVNTAGQGLTIGTGQ